MVDLMMWLVIAALLLATAIQGIGYYQKNATLYSMKNDAMHAAEAVMAKMSSEGKTTDTVGVTATEESAKTQDISTVYEAGSSDADGFVIRSTSDSVDTDVLFLSKQRGTYSPGIHVVPEGTVIEPDGTTAVVEPDATGTGGAVQPTIDTSNVMTTVWDTSKSYDHDFQTWNNYSTQTPMLPCTTITIPITGDVDATINWGDGSPLQTVRATFDPEYNTPVAPFPSRTYTDTPGIHTVTITGTFTTWVGYDWGKWSNGCLTNITKWGDGTGTVDAEGGFFHATELVDIARIPKTLTNAADLLDAVSPKFTGASLRNWDTSNVEHMGGMFAYTSFNGDISNWDTSSVKDFTCMFCESTFNGDISKWDTSSATRMFLMFQNNPAFNQNIGKWNVSNVREASRMFDGATSFNQNLTLWKFQVGAGSQGFSNNSALTPENMPTFQ